MQDLPFLLASPPNAASISCPPFRLSLTCVLNLVWVHSCTAVLVEMGGHLVILITSVEHSPAIRKRSCTRQDGNTRVQSCSVLCCAVPCRTRHAQTFSTCPLLPTWHFGLLNECLHHLLVVAALAAMLAGCALFKTGAGLAAQKGWARRERWEGRGLRCCCCSFLTHSRNVHV